MLRGYLSHRPDDHLSRILAVIRRAASTEFVIQPGLFNGRAGLMLPRTAEQLPELVTC